MSDSASSLHSSSTDQEALKRLDDQTPSTEQHPSPQLSDSLTEESKTTPESVDSQLVWETSGYVIQPKPYQYETRNLVPVNTGPPLATHLWSVDADGIHIAHGTVFVTNVGVRPEHEAFFHLVLSRYVYDVYWQPVTVETLERKLDPDRRLDPIILRQRLWESTPSAAWWDATRNGPRQPGLDIDLISNYYGQRCTRSVRDQIPRVHLRYYSSSSGARILVQKQNDASVQGVDSETSANDDGGGGGDDSETSIITNPYRTPPPKRSKKHRGGRLRRIKT